MAFDIKLKDGRYFESVVLWVKRGEGCEDDFEEEINWIISQYNDYAMDIIEDICGYDIGETVASIISSDIEYICETYKYEVKNND